MAKIRTSFECMICKEALKFPDNIDMARFMLMMLQFHEVHNLCEKMAPPSKSGDTKKSKKK